MKNVLKKVVIVVAALSLTSCGFVNYTEAPSSMEQSLVDELSKKRNEYISLLEETYNEDNYEAEEKKQLRYCLIEAKAEFLECNDVEEIAKLLDKHKAIIDAIKTKKQYAEELANKKSEYEDKIKAISDETLYREKEKETYNYYVEKAIEAIDALPSIKEDFDKVFSAYKTIIEAIKTDADYVKEEQEAFDKYKTDAINAIDEYVNLDDYRDNESNSIKKLLETAKESIKDAEEYDEIDGIVRKYKIDVYQYETDAELYNKELLALIDDSKEEVSNYLNLSNYRDNEVAIINTLIDSFGDKVVESKLKEEVDSLVETYKGLLDAIKTDAQLYDEEKTILIENLFEEIKTIVGYDSLSTEDKEYYDNFYNSLVMLATKEQVESSFNAEKKKAYREIAVGGDGNALVQYQLCVIDDLYLYLDKSLYRDEQKQEIDIIISNSYASILSCLTCADTDNIVSDVEADLDNVLTNEEMWEQEDANFYTDLNTLYGDSVLTPLSSMVEADSLLELANIIDYYAFYQTDSEHFVRDTFRIKLNFEYNNVSQVVDMMKNDYTELAKYSTTLTGWQEGDYVVFKLTPHNFGSVHYDGNDIVLQNSSVTFNDGTNPASKSVRANDFDDFAYKSNVKTVKVWNTQQLWYALEHNYVPVCKAGSIAESTLDNVKEVLRSIIKEGMSDKEKIFSIYTWLAATIPFAHGGDNPTMNMDNYPESAFIDGYFKCRGYAKLYVIMLRVEGIDAYLTYKHGSEHELVLIDIDDAVYCSDPTLSNHWTNKVTYKYLLYECKIMNPMYDSFNYASEHSDIYNYLFRNDKCIYVKTEQEYVALLNDYIETRTSNEYLDIIFENNNDFIDVSILPGDVSLYVIINHYGYNYQIREMIVSPEE